MKIFDNHKHLKELVELSSTFFYADDLTSDFEVILVGGSKIEYSSKNTILIDPESEYGRIFETDRYTCDKLEKLRPNNIILTSHFTDKDVEMCFYPIHWIRVISGNTPPKKSDHIIKDGLCMLGGWTPRRKIIYEKLIQYKENIMISYYPRQCKDWDDDHTERIHYYVDPLIEKLDIPEFRNQCILKNRLFTQEKVISIIDDNITYSQLIPQKLFSHINIHFVAETEDDFQLKENKKSEGFFVTEKSGKALYSGSPWVIYGAEGFLQNLRYLGFETFGDIIDESYDDVRCSVKRAARAADSFIEFINQPERVKRLALQKVKSRCEQNQKLISDLKIWTAPVEEKIKKML